MFSLSNFMYITQETIHSLQILQSEQHPNELTSGAQSAGGVKESLSVYGLFHHLAGTLQGRACLRRLFLRPTLDMAVISERQRFIALLRQPKHAEHLKQASSILRKVGNAKRVLVQVRKGAESPSSSQSDNRGAWATLKRFATQVLRLRELLATIIGYKDIEIISEVCSYSRRLPCYPWKKVTQPAPRLSTTQNTPPCFMLET